MSEDQRRQVGSAGGVQAHASSRHTGMPPPANCDRQHKEVLQPSHLCQIAVGIATP